MKAIWRVVSDGRLSGAALFITLVVLAGCAQPVPLTPPLPEVAPPSPAAVTPELPTSTPEPLPLDTPVPIPTATPVPLADAPASVAYALPLVTQHVTETAAALFFELERPAEGIVLAWRDDDPSQQQAVAFAAGQARQQITLEGLEPGAAYRALVALGPEPDSGLYRPVIYRGEQWGPVSFRTPSEQQPLRIGVIGDGGFGDPVTYGLAEEMAGYDLDFVLHTGDVVYAMYNDPGPFDSYALKWYLPYEPLLASLPLYPVVGNHDVEAAAQWQGRPFYYHVFPPFTDPRFPPSDLAGRNQWYAFAYGDIQFLMLDTQSFFGEPGRAEQAAWLAERLADSRFRASVPVFHVPPYTYGRHTSSGPAVQTWVPLFEEARVPLVLSGHDHNYQRIVRNNITYVISGGGSAVLYDASEPPPDDVVFARRAHFVLLEVSADQIALQAIALGGEVIDRATIPLP